MRTADLIVRYKSEAEACLEAARLEVCRRLCEQHLPSTITIEHLVVEDPGDGSGWSSTAESIPRSALRDHTNLEAVSDTTVVLRTLGLREQLTPLAETLNETTELGGGEMLGFKSTLTGVDGILMRVLAPLAQHYLMALDDVAQPNPKLAERLGGELADLALGKVSQTTHLLLSGLSISEELPGQKGVTIRELSALERAAVAEVLNTSTSLDFVGDVDFLVPTTGADFEAQVLLTVVEPLHDSQRLPLLALRVALSLLLHGFELCSPGRLISFIGPRWFAPATFSITVPITNRRSPPPPARSLEDEMFKAVVDLARKMPDFDQEEQTREAIVCNRVLKGCGAASGGFLDLTIALEAALLAGLTTKLSYRFSRYGALFLASERDTTTTYDHLRTIYRVRSKLVHGTPVAPAERRAAEALAVDLAKAVTKRAFETGWPDAKVIDRQARGLPAEVSEEGDLDA